LRDPNWAKTKFPGIRDPCISKGTEYVNSFGNGIGNMT
jgi:hypothetical protein